MARQSIAEALVENYQKQAGLISVGQISEDDFEEWCSLSIAIFKLSRALYQNKSWVSFADLRQLPENQEIYSLIAQIFGMIGLVNGYPLRRDSDLSGLFVSYIYVPAKPEEKEIVSSDNKRSYFRLRLERYLARLIIEQQQKSVQLLIDENEDLRHVRRLKSNRNKKYKREQLSLTAEISQEPVIPEISVAFETLLVRCNSTKCNKNHDVKPVHVLIDIMMPAGTVINEQINAGYCQECNVYFILEYDYRRLRALGVLLCQVVSSEVYLERKLGTSGKLDLKAESLLHQSGYNVSATENLSTVQRQEILKRVMSNNIYSPAELVSFLDWLINRNEKMKNKDMSSALSKWQADRQFVIAYQKQKCK